MTRTLETMQGLYRSGYFADDATPGETFREVAAGLDALDEITPAPRTAAPTVRLFCYGCRSWFDGPPQNRYGNGVCSDCLIAYGDNEHQTIERNRQRPPTRCTLCGAESRTFVCEACDSRPMSQRTPFDYRRLEQQAALPATDGDFCEDCGARLIAGFDDCSVCEGVGPGGYCSKCGTRKIPMMGLAGIPLSCPFCG